jgi:C-terminal processing protease CtpA/Prc
MRHPYVDAGLGCLEALDRQGPLVLDLRNNTGGNCHLMLMVLAPLLSPGPLVGWAFGDATQWLTYDGTAVINGSGLRYPTRPPLDTPDRIAVLVSGRTASSGEVVVLSVKGRPNVRVFGTETCGLTTANDVFELSDGYILGLAVAQMVSSIGDEPHGAIAPDEHVDAEHALDRALAWLAGG